MVQFSLVDALMICFSPKLDASLLHLCMIITIKLLPCNLVSHFRWARLMFSNQILFFCRLVVIDPELGDCAVLRRFRLARSQEGLFK